MILNSGLGLSKSDVRLIEARLKWRSRGKMMKNIMAHAAAVLACVALLSGCTNLSVSSEQLRADPQQKGTVSLAAPYPVVSANITASANKCFPTKSLYYDPGYLASVTAPQMSVRSDELEPGKLARVKGLTTSARSLAEPKSIITLGDASSALMMRAPASYRLLLPGHAGTGLSVTRAKRPNQDTTGD